MHGEMSSDEEFDVGELVFSDFEINETVIGSSDSEEQDVLGGGLSTEIAWASFFLSKPVLQALSDMKFKNPTPIQRDCLPKALLGKDIIATAHTGSGKTAAFMIPSIERLLRSPQVSHRSLSSTGQILNVRSAVTKVLVLLPTRELANQCYSICNDLCRYTPITRMLLCGGIDLHQQEQEIKTNPDIVISTPGRCLDLLLNMRSVNFDLLDILIFDEADKLIDMGFRDVCLAVVNQCNTQRQTLLFSATLDFNDADFIKIATRNAERITDGKSRAADSSTLKQASSVANEFVQIANEQARYPALLRTMYQEIEKGTRRILVFFNTKRAAHDISMKFRQLELPFEFSELHADLDNDKRTAAISNYVDKKIEILFSTELVARGIDFKDLELVINADAPTDEVKFIHRVGRTGRAGKPGRAITIYNHETERTNMKRIFKAVKANGSDKFTKGTVLSEDDLRDEIERIRMVEKSSKKLENIERLNLQADRMIKVAERAIQTGATHAGNVKEKRSWIDTRKTQKKNRSSRHKQ